MRFRKLRIAWSVGWGIAALLLCVLWVRSYWMRDVLTYGFPGRVSYFFGTTEGRISLARIYPANGETDDGFFYWNYPSTGVPAWEASNMSRVWGIRFKREPTGTVLLDVPQAYFLVVAVMGSVIPWLSTRFSLRTLLIATTLVALRLGLIVWLR